MAGKQKSEKTHIKNKSALTTLVFVWKKIMPISAAMPHAAPVRKYMMAGSRTVASHARCVSTRTRSASLTALVIGV